MRETRVEGGAIEKDKHRGTCWRCQSEMDEEGEGKGRRSEFDGGGEGEGVSE